MELFLRKRYCNQLLKYFEFPKYCRMGVFIKLKFLLKLEVFRFLFCISTSSRWKKKINLRILQIMRHWNRLRALLLEFLWFEDSLYSYYLPVFKKPKFYWLILFAWFWKLFLKNLPTNFCYLMCRTVNFSVKLEKLCVLKFSNISTKYDSSCSTWSMTPIMLIEIMH